MDEGASRLGASGPGASSPQARLPLRVRLGRRLAGPLLVLPAGVWLVLFLAIPLAIVLVYSLGHTAENGAIVFGFSLDWYKKALSSVYLTVFLRSLLYAGLATAACLVLGYPLAYWVARQPSGRKEALLLLIMLPFWTSFLIRTYSWQIILRTDGVANSLLQDVHLTSGPVALLNNGFAVVLGLTYDFLPFMTLPLYASLEKLDFTLIEAASDLYATRREQFLRVVLPLSAPGVVAGTLLTFIPAIGDFITPTLLGGPHNLMIGNFIEENFLANNNWPFGSAQSFLLMGILLVGVFWYVRRFGSEELA